MNRATRRRLRVWWRVWWRRFVRRWLIDDDPADCPLWPPSEAARYYPPRVGQRLPLLDIEIPPLTAPCIHCGRDMTVEEVIDDALVCAECCAAISWRHRRA